MTEKRFTIQGRGISDHKRKRLYDLETIDGFISLREVLNELEKENEQLKKELTKLKEWEKYVGDIKREELDAVFKMSIYEIAEGFEYYKKRIKELENEVKE